MSLPAALRRAAAHAALLVAPTALAAPCGAPVPGASVGAQHSQWQERGADGRTLVRERGTLRMAGVHLQGDCQGLDWRAEWSFSQGRRDYDGLTSTQAPLLTSSRLRQQRLQLQAWLPLQGDWSLGGQLAYSQIHRDIASAGAVLGYPERFGYVQAAAGLRHQADLGGGLRLTTSAWLGGGPGGHVRLSLPRFDEARLPLGASRMAALAVQLAGGAAAQQPGWSWQGELGWRHERTAAGQARTLTRSGVPAGSALQPRFAQTHTSVSLQASYRF